MKKMKLKDIMQKLPQPHTLVIYGVVLLVVFVLGINLSNRNQKIELLEQALERKNQQSESMIAPTATPNLEGMAKLNIYTHPEGPINNWEDGARAGYQLQKGEITEEDIWLPNGSSSVVAAAEHGYYAGIIMACAEGHIDENCQDAADYAKKYSLNMDVEPSENEGGYY